MLSCGIVGLPNVGKSTLFKALTKKQVLIENYPFATIEPNVGIVSVPDERLEKLTVLSHSEKIIPAAIKFVDIAGLVRGAHKGEGLGNKFLSHIREVDLIIEVVRGFIDDNIIHVAGIIDPKSDQEVIDLELIMADLETANKRLETVRAKAKSGTDKDAVRLVVLLEKIKSHLEKGSAARELELTDEEKELIQDLNLLTIKPILYVLNISESEAKNRVQLPQEKNQIAISCKIEAELAELNESDARAMMQELGIAQSGLDKLIIASYALLDLITFFTTGPKETRGWTVRRNAFAPEAAGKIHTDFEKGFISAEIISYNDFIAVGSETAAREKGSLRIEGKNYVIKDGDVAHFRFNL